MLGYGQWENLKLFKLIMGEAQRLASLPHSNKLLGSNPHALQILQKTPASQTRVRGSLKFLQISWGEV